MSTSQGLPRSVGDARNVGLPRGENSTRPAREASAEGPAEQIRNALQILAGARVSLEAGDCITAEHHIKSATRRLERAVLELEQLELFPGPDGSGGDFVSMRDDAGRPYAISAHAFAERRAIAAHHDTPGRAPCPCVVCVSVRDVVARG